MASLQQLDLSGERPRGEEGHARPRPARHLARQQLVQRGVPHGLRAQRQHFVAPAGPVELSPWITIQKELNN